MSPGCAITDKQVERSGSFDDPPDLASNRKCGARGWIDDAVEQLVAISELSAGWDSSGAPSPDKSILQGAFGLLKCLHECGDIPRPHINPTRDGGVQFEWESGSRYFEIEVVAPMAAGYFYEDAATGTQEEGQVFVDESLEAVLSYIRTVATG